MTLWHQSNITFPPFVHQRPTRTPLYIKHFPFPLHSSSHSSRQTPSIYHPLQPRTDPSTLTLFHQSSTRLITRSSLVLALHTFQHLITFSHTQCLSRQSPSSLSLLLPSRRLVRARANRTPSPLHPTQTSVSSQQATMTVLVSPLPIVTRQMTSLGHMTVNH